MHKIQKHIEIVRSSGKGVCSLGKESSDQIELVLSKHYAQVGVTVIDNLNDLKQLVNNKPDLVFLGMKILPKGAPNNEHSITWISEYLEANGIEHTGSSRRAIELELSKQLSKQQVLDAGLNTAPFIVLKNGEPFVGAAFPLTFPLFIKPTNLGGGRGINADSVVHTVNELNIRALYMGNKYSTDVLVEEYLTGREFSVSILKKENSADYSIMPLELIAPPDKNGDQLLGYEVKKLDVERSISVPDNHLKASITTLAIGVFKAIKGRDYGRIDIRLDKNGVPNFLEANLVPSIKNNVGNYFPKACRLNIGMGHDEMVMRISNLGFERCNPEFQASEPKLITALVNA